MGQSGSNPGLQTVASSVRQSVNGLAVQSEGQLASHVDAIKVGTPKNFRRDPIAINLLPLTILRNYFPPWRGLITRNDYSSSVKKKSADFSVRNVLHDRLNPLHPNISMHILYTVL